VRAGFGSQILLSHDITCAARCPRTLGYAHLLTDFLPLLAVVGLDEAEVRKFVTPNPRAALTGEAST
jgi:predicted metal-dependent phosphotriesterase family hydrolase